MLTNVTGLDPNPGVGPIFKKCYDELRKT